MDNTATESSITCPHYKLEIVYLKPELVAAFEKLDRRLTYDFKIIGKYWHQGEPDGRFLVLPNEKKKQNLEGKRKKAKVQSLSDPCSHNYPSVKVIQIPPQQKGGYKVKITLFVLGFVPIDWVTDGSGVKERETRPKQW